MPCFSPRFFCRCQAYVDGELKVWNKAALRMIRQAISEKEGEREGTPRVSLASATPTPDTGPPQPLLRSKSGWSSGIRRGSSVGCVNDSSVGMRCNSAAGHDGMIDPLLRFGREQTVAHEPSQTGALTPGSQSEDGQQTDDDRSRRERLESAMSDEKEEEGFVLARDSRGLHDYGGDTGRGLGEGDEGDGDERSGVMEALIDTAGRLVKAVDTLQQVRSWGHRCV